MHFDLCPNIHSVYFIIKTSFEFRPIMWKGIICVNLLPRVHLSGVLFHTRLD